MWPQGWISGTVRDAAGQPLAGVTVQAFAFDQKGKRESRPIRTGESNGAGQYRIEPLPEGEYIIGVNAEEYADSNPFPPTLFHAADRNPGGTQITVSESGKKSGIDLILPPKRISAKLQVQVVTADGSPYAGAYIKLLNSAGIQRGLSRESTSEAGLAELTVYQGEQYIVEASALDSSDLGRKRDYDYLGGRSDLTVLLRDPKLTIVLTPKRFKE
jgi:hypothetical protein